MTRSERREKRDRAAKADVEARLASLAAAAGVPRAPSLPDNLEREYVRARLRALEAAVDALRRRNDVDEEGGR